jgi:hypothetical protein
MHVKGLETCNGYCVWYCPRVLHLCRYYVCIYVCMHFLIYLFIYLFVIYLKTLFSNEDYTASNDRAVWITNWKWFGRNQSLPNFKVLSQHSPGGNKENHNKPPSGMSVFGPRFEFGTFGIQRRSVKHSKTKFGYRDAAALFYTDLLSKYSNFCSGCPLIESVRYCTQWIVSRYSNNQEAYIISVYFLICRP